MKRIFASRTALVVMLVASVFVVGCGGSNTDAAEAPKGTPQRSDVQSTPVGGGAGQQQTLSNTQKSTFDNTK